MTMESLDCLALHTLPRSPYYQYLSLSDYHLFGMKYYVSKKTFKNFHDIDIEASYPMSVLASGQDLKSDEISFIILRFQVLIYSCTISMMRMNYLLS